MADIKNIDVFQTVTSVSFEVEPNTNIININKVTTSGYTGVPNLQEVTDEGATTTNGITINVGDGGGNGISSTSSQGSGVYGSSSETYGVYGNSPAATGVYGTSDNGYGVQGYSESGIAVYGSSQEQIGVQGNSVLGTAISAYSDYGVGLYAGSESNVGVSAYSNSIGLEVNGNGTIAIEANLGNLNKGLVINSGASSTGNFIELDKNGVDKLVVNQQGELTATKLIKQGGTSSQFLMADGSVSTGGGGGGATNLSPSQTATNFTINSDTGTDATIPLGNGTLAGATLNNYTTAEKNKLAAITGTNTGDQNLQSVTNIGGSTTNPINVLITGVSNAITGQSGTGTGVLGISDGGKGIDGSSNTGIGVNGYSETGVGGSFETDSVSANIANFKNTGSIVASVTNNGNINANAFVKSGGTSSQILAADGSVITAGTNIIISGGTISSTGGSSGGGISNATAAGTDTYTATISGVSSYVDGAAYLIRFTNGNTTNATLNINGLGAIALYRNNDGALIGGDIQNGGEMLCVYNSTITAFQCIGTSPNDIVSYVTNADSVTITKGMPVYAFGGTGDRMTVKRAYNTLDSSSAQTVGIVMSTSIAAGQKGIIITQGLLDGLSILPTSTFADGDTIYLGATAGTITNVKPYAPNHLVYLGVVTTASAGAAGRMYVKVQNGYELDELHNVQAQSPTLKDTLWYDNTVSPAQWKTASIPTILGYTPVQSNTAITGATNTKITYDSKGLVTSGTAATTADISDSTNKRYVTDANLTIIGNTSGTNTGDQNLSGYALLASPTFTGTPSLPTGTTGTTQTPLNNSTRLATTAYVEEACAVIAASNGVTVSSQDTFGTARIATVTAAQYAAFVTAGTVSATTLYFITA